MLLIFWQAGKTVITTIHQPSSRLFHKFDKLILLGNGSLLYFGKASDAMVYFSSVGCSPLIAMNPAEFLLDLANGNLNDVSIPSELEDKVQMGNSERETRNGRPSPAMVHEVNSLTRKPLIQQMSAVIFFIYLKIPELNFMYLILNLCVS